MKPHEHVILEIARERERQIAKSLSPDQDDQYRHSELAYAAAAYAVHGAPREQLDFWGGRPGFPNRRRRAGWVMISSLLWPWTPPMRHGEARRARLVKAGALIVAEIERLDRAASEAAS